MANYWIVKTDPETYSWDDLVRDKFTVWDGVRNYQARNNLAQMELGDKLLFYHSQKDKAIVGIAEVTREAFPDPTILDDPRWLAVEIKPVEKFSKPVTLQQIKNEPALKNLGLIKQSRLSVIPINEEEFEYIVKMSK